MSSLAVEYVETECGKRGFRGRGSAVKAAKSTKYKHMYGTGREPVHAYHCRDCGFWHVGHAVGWEGRKLGKGRAS